MSASIPFFSLNDGNKIPSVGLGCWLGQPGGGDKVFQMVQTALKHGYRHIDTAFGYENEEYVGKAIRESGIPRGEIFVTTKLAQIHHGSVQEGLELSLRNLDIDYVDLYLMHWPQAANEKGEPLQPEEGPSFIETWLSMEKLLETGKVKSIGVSNFSIKTLDVLLPKANIIPATNQVELHPCLPQTDLKKYCEDKGILLTAYSPFGQPEKDHMVLLQEPIIGEVAERTGSSVGQVLVSWAVQRRTVVIPKSEKEERIKQNITLVKLSETDMKALDELHLKPGMHRSLLRYYTNGGVFGWTNDQLGWNRDGDGVVV
ncbi:Aldo/keto reductase [Phellopilus nigrolimitatus]|nr:Aldo/keto reductase [Phellopilus nigrolimitatus]